MLSKHFLSEWTILDDGPSKCSNTSLSFQRGTVLGMNEQHGLVSDQTARSVLDLLLPGSVLTAITALTGSLSNATCLVSAQAADGSVARIVVRRYAIFGNYDRGEKARREYTLFQLLQHSSVPVPEPPFLDDTGSLLGSPGIVTKYVPGTLELTASDTLAWAASMARTLANIHNVPLDHVDRGFLLDAHSEAFWFLKAGDEIPPYIAAHPKGAEVWYAIKGLMPTMQNVPKCLVHIDYWPGQLLWDKNQIVAVVDWEEVAYCDPAYDVAYCRMQLARSGHAEAGEEFLRAYEQVMGRKTPNLTLFELAATIRPMFSSPDRISKSPERERFIEFIDDVLQKSGL